MINRYQRKIVKTLMQRQFHSYEKLTGLNVHITDVAIFSHISDYKKHKLKYEMALVECVQLNYIVEFREKSHSYFCVTEHGLTSLSQWKQRLWSIITFIAGAVVSAVISVLIEWLIGKI